jgi:hypothetical protein
MRDDVSWSTANDFRSFTSAAIKTSDEIYKETIQSNHSVVLKQSIGMKVLLGSLFFW